MKLQEEVPQQPRQNQQKKSNFARLSIALLAAGTLFLTGTAVTNNLKHPDVEPNFKGSMTNHGQYSSSSSSGLCVNPDKLQPESYKNDASSLDFLNSAQFRNESLKRFQNALRIPTESNEIYGQPGEDERWEIFTQLHDQLEKDYPKLHQNLEREVVNKYGLLYTWKGSDESLKPVVLMAHQDVVPVLPETFDQWTHHPYSADFDGKKVWSRGAMDDKNPLISIMEAVELLINDGVQQPKRTVLISFGYDEESSGTHGAQYLAKRIEEKYGEDSVHALIDEGSFGIFRFKGTDMALVSVSEKGNYGADITLYTKGGHSSVPPDHTGIGIVSQLINLVESTPHTAQLTDRNPLLKSAHCIGEHSDNLDAGTRKMLKAAGKCPRATQQLVKGLSQVPSFKYLMQTSQAVDIIQGGLKINALPEQVTVRIDNRVSVDSSTKEVEAKLFDNVKTIAKEHGLGLRYEDQVIIEGDQYFEFKPFNVLPLEPAPYSSVEGEAYEQFAGTVRHVFEDFAGPIFDVNTLEFKDDKNIVVVPSMMSGNTDTRFYWNLTNNIFRFNPQRLLVDPTTDEAFSGVHTVNEHIDYDIHIETIAFYRQYMLNL